MNARVMFDCQFECVQKSACIRTNGYGEKEPNNNSRFNGGFMHNFFHSKHLDGFCCCQLFSFSHSMCVCVCVISPAFVLILLFIYFSLFVSMWYETIGILLLFAASTARSLLPFFHLFILVHRSPFLLLLLFLVLYVQCCVSALQIYCYPLTYRHTFSSWKHTVCIKQKKHKKWNNQTQKNLA